MLALLGLTMISTTVMAQNPKKFLKAGDDFMGTGNYEDAINQFSRAIELDPDYTKAYLARAEAFEKLGKTQEAFDDYNRAYVFLPKEEEVAYHLGKLSNELGEYERAMVFLNQATNLSRKFSPAYQEKIMSLIEMEDYQTAIAVCDTALALENNAINYYYHGVVSELLNQSEGAEMDYVKSVDKDRNFMDGILALARIRLELGKLDQAMRHCESALRLDNRNTEAYMIRSKIHVKNLDYPSAINDLSKNILIEPDNPEMYFQRGIYYQEFNQHTNAISDFSKAITMNQKDPDLYFKRARSYEEILNYAAAVKDYETIASLSEFDMQARKLLKEANERLYELNRESDKPKIALETPATIDNQSINIARNEEEIVIKGIVNDQSDLEFLRINGKEIIFEKKGGDFEFLANVDVEGFDTILVEASDVYHNQQGVAYAIQWTETDPPLVRVLAPYASDVGEVYLDSNEPSLYIEGKIEDKNTIRCIFVEGVTASYRLDELNPSFSATINIMNKNKFTVVAEDVYGNKVEQEFKLNREGAVLTETNPMGKTWVVFIENSNYESFASLDGPTKDVSLMKAALANYQIHNIIHKQDMSKDQMEKFFSIDLRDLVRSNRVNSLLVWYAGHGKYINESGYWIPVDAQRDDEFTYFNINSLKAGMQSYSNYITHTLVVTDACESGSTFYQAMRSTIEERSCDDWQATRLKSSQVFSSAGYELAVDNSQFTRTFANALVNNPNACIPIENIVTTVSKAVERNNQQKPKFGKIVGFEDENGTFFFIAKE